MNVISSLAARAPHLHFPGKWQSSRNVKIEEINIITRASSCQLPHQQTLWTSPVSAGAGPYVPSQQQQSRQLAPPLQGWNPTGSCGSREQGMSSVWSGLYIWRSGLQFGFCLPWPCDFSKPLELGKFESVQYRPFRPWREVPTGPRFMEEFQVRE